MRYIAPELEKWITEGEAVALATVVQTWGSAPRRPGARMAVTASGKIAGSVSGGCVEAAVAEAGLEALRTGRSKILDFNVADEAAWQVGLACGGAIQVLVKPLNGQAARSIISAVGTSLPVADIMVVRGPERLIGAHALYSEGGRIGGELETAHEHWARSLASQAIAVRTPGRFDLQTMGGDLGVFVDVILPPPVLIVVGGVHVAAALCSIARVLGYRTVVVDPRRAFGNHHRFPQVDLLLQAWPEDAFVDLELTADSAVCTLTHDPKIDDEGLKLALNSRAFYVGALGSRTTQAARRERLLEAGIGKEQLARLHGPIGIDIGAVTPEEIALSIMAEIIAVRNGQPQGSREGALSVEEASG